MVYSGGKLERKADENSMRLYSIIALHDWGVYSCGWRICIILCFRIKNPSYEMKIRVPLMHNTIPTLVQGGVTFLPVQALGMRNEKR